MIVLDTNVFSEGMKPSADPAATAWLDARDAGSIYVSSVTLAELSFGINCLPTGRRKRAMALDEVLGVFGDRALAFDARAARAYAHIAVRARAAGLGLPIPDGYIAAIAAAHGFAVAPRDTGPFQAAGVAVIDPWVLT